MALDTNNFYGRLLIALFERIKSEVPEIKWICEDLAQLEDFETRPPVAFPCALIDFPDTSFQGSSEKGQIGTATISIRLGFDTFAVANAHAPSYPVEATLQRYAIEQKLVKALHGWGNEDLFQPLTRVSAVGEKRSDGCRVRTLTFTTDYEDNNMQDVFDTHAVSISITGGIKEIDA